MIRVVAIRKAVAAGVGGAIAMEIFSRVGALLGLKTIDFIAELSSVAFGGSRLLADSAAVIAHLTVGVCWAIFYAFFFWGRLRKLRPPLQGLVFAILPAVLATFVVYPELALIHHKIDVINLTVAGFFAPLSVPAIASILIGHALFGLTMGAIYRKPVGYRVGTKPSAPVPARRSDSSARRKQGSAGFMFATGIECSYPTIDHGRWRRDEMESTYHYSLWQRDFELARELGITHIRYGPPLHLIFTGPGRYDWSWSDEAMAELERFGPEPIVDLCHFGVPDWLGEVQNPDLAPALAEYAGAFAERYPWVRLYTPVNEMYVCARMSALDGNWNEQQSDEASFIRAAINLASASIAMTDSILARRGDAIFVNSESSDFTQPCCPDPDIVREADLENERRFLPLDLIYARDLGDRMKDHLGEQGFADVDLGQFSRRNVPRRSVLGLDYYEWNERLIDSRGRIRALGELFGWYVIANQYYDRYRRPMMHTETNRMDAADAPRWLWRQWHNVQLMRKSGIPLVGFTWYSLTDQIDWSIALTEVIGLVFPVGLVDLNRDVRTVGLAYKRLIDMFSGEPEFADCGDVAELRA